MPDEKPDVEGPCPFCFRPIKVWWNDPPGKPGEFHHALPECREFKTMTADEFVQAVINGQHKQ